MLWTRTTPVALAAAVAMLSPAACGDKTVGQAPPAAAPAGSAAAAAPTGADQLAGMNLAPGTAKSNDSPPDTGDWADTTGQTRPPAPSDPSQRWVQLKASKAGDLRPVVVNGRGRTLYRFDKDTAKPAKSNCNGDCAVTWPPVTVAPGGKIFIAGVDKGAVGVVRRDDGNLQVTVAGWPVYRFSKDKKAGDTLGQGVGGTWFGVQPDGRKSGVGAGSDTSDQGGSTSGSGRQSEPATSAVLFDDKDFSDDGASQGVAGQGCKDLSRPRVASSVAAPGRLKLWAKAGCKGDSVVIDGDGDLAAVNFDNKAASVFLG